MALERFQKKSINLLFSRMSQENLKEIRAMLEVYIKAEEEENGREIGGHSGVCQEKGSETQSGEQPH